MFVSVPFAFRNMLECHISVRTMHVYLIHGVNDCCDQKQSWDQQYRPHEPRKRANPDSFGTASGLLIALFRWLVLRQKSVIFSGIVCLRLHAKTYAEYNLEASASMPSANSSWERLSEIYKADSRLLVNNAAKHWVGQGKFGCSNLLTVRVTLYE